MSSKLMIGFAAGLAVGLLFAPDKGTETRRKLREKTNDLKNRFNDFVDGLSAQVDDLTEEADEFANKAKSQFT